MWDIALRPATVHRLELLSIQPPDRLWLRVVCSAGFYVRSLAYDSGEHLGTGGHIRVTCAGRSPGTFWWLMPIPWLRWSVPLPLVLWPICCWPQVWDRRCPVCR